MKPRDENIEVIEYLQRAETHLLMAASDLKMARKRLIYPSRCPLPKRNYGRVLTDVSTRSTESRTFLGRHANKRKRGD